MRSKLTKTIILIVFVVFLGINNVEAKTCVFTKTTNSSVRLGIFGDQSLEDGTIYAGVKEEYIIETDATGKVASIKFREVSTKTTFSLGEGFNVDQTVNKEEDLTNQLTVDFIGCPVSIGRSGDKLTSSGNTYKNLDRLGENAGGSDYVGTLDPGEDSSTVSCGNITDIPSNIPKTTKIIYNLIQILVPIVLVVLGMLDLAKAVMAQKEDEIKKGQQTLIKRLVSAAIVFFVFAIVKMVATYLSDNSSVGSCMNCFIKGDCQVETVEIDPDATDGEDGEV